MIFRLCWVFLIVSVNSAAQNLTSLYDVQSLPQSLLSNPGANINFDKHIGIPFLSGFRVSGVSSGLTIYDVFSDDGQDVNLKLRNAINNLSPDKDYFLVRNKIDFLNAGFHLNKNNYLSFGIYQDSDLFFNLPRDVLYLGQSGNSGTYDSMKFIDPFRFTGDISTVFHLGLNKKINKSLILGARFKIYSSVLNIRSINNSGQFYTTRDEFNNVNNVYENVNILIRTAGFQRFDDTWQSIKNGITQNTGNADDEEIEDQPQPMSITEASLLFMKRAFFSGNYGVGIDAGFTYFFDDNLQATFSFEDLGAVYLKTDTKNYRYYGEYQHDGIEVDFEEGVGNSVDYWDDFILNLEDSFEDEETYESYISWKPTQINSSIKYSFTEISSPCDYKRITERYYKYNVGLQFHGVNRPHNFLYKMAAFFESRFTYNTVIKATYSLNNYSYDNLGLMLSTFYKKFNFYIATDNILSFGNLAKANNTSVQLGVQFVFRDN